MQTENLFNTYESYLLFDIESKSEGFIHEFVIVNAIQREQRERERI